MTSTPTTTTTTTAAAAAAAAAAGSSTYTGGCQCGAVRYKLTAAPVHTSLCHCRACQRENGSTHTLSHIIPASSFTITSPAEKNTVAEEKEPVIRTHTRTASSGNAVRNYFCTRCGTTCWCASDLSDAHGVLSVRAGTLDDAPTLNELWRPESELYCRQRYGWMATATTKGEEEAGEEGMIGQSAVGARAFEGMVGKEEADAVLNG